MTRYAPLRASIRPAGGLCKCAGPLGRWWPQHGGVVPGHPGGPAHRHPCSRVPVPGQACRVSLGAALRSALHPGVSPGLPGSHGAGALPRCARQKPMHPLQSRQGQGQRLPALFDYCRFQVLPLTANALAAPRNRSDTVSSHITSSVTTLPAARICCVAPAIAFLTFGLSN